jgi:hypothetical protein
MIQFLLVSIFFSAALSLISYVYCWQDIRSGRPHIISLRQITAIMDRKRLNRIFGMPEPGYYYPLSPELMYELIRKRRWFYTRECTADITCILGVWLYMTGRLPATYVGWFAALAGICQMINLVYSLFLISKWHSQLREEIDNSEY